MSQKIDLESVKHAISESNEVRTTLSPNRLVTDQAQRLEKNNSTDSINSEDKPVSATSYNSECFFTSFNNLFISLISPKEAGLQSTFFKEGEKPTFGKLAEFYLYHLILTLIYIVMTLIRAFQFAGNKIKLRFLSVAYNPADDPEVINGDVNKLSKIPRRISAILNYKSEQEENGGIEGLCNDSAKVATWCLSAGIRYLSLYEYHGILKKSIPQLKRAIFKKFTTYFGTENIPSFIIKVPHLSRCYPGCVDGKLVEEGMEVSKTQKYDIEITLLHNVDGRMTIVELTRVMADLAKKGDLKSKDITMRFMDQELQQLVGKEPDLVVLFQPFLNLQGYPPWQIRLSELYWEPDNDGTNYFVFLRALQKYSTCKINVGR